MIEEDKQLGRSLKQWKLESRRSEIFVVKGEQNVLWRDESEHWSERSLFMNLCEHYEVGVCREKCEQSYDAEC